MVGAVIFLFFFNYFHKRDVVADVQQQQNDQQEQQKRKLVPMKMLPSRMEMLKKLKDPNNVYDVLVIGGGATGCGVALDSITRGLSTALVELDDFSSGTSSRSTKLIHGGVRYLQKAILKLDYDQYHMVREAVSNILPKRKSEKVNFLFSIFSNSYKNVLIFWI